MTRTPQVVVQRWTRYGQDRAYVRIDDRRVGYRDLQTGAVVCDHSGYAPVIASATDDLVTVQYVPRHAT